MAKSKIISASIAVDIQNLQEVTGAVQGLSKDLSNIPIDKNLETRLKNVEKTVTNVVKQISTMTDKIDVLSKAGGLDPKTLNDLSLLTTALSDVRIEVDALTTKVNNFSKGISDVGDIGIKKVSENISKEIGNMANNIDTSISNATVSIQKGGEKLKKTYEQLLQSVNAELDVEGIDATKIFKFSNGDDVDAEFKKVKAKLQKDLKDLADATTNYNDLKIGGGSADDVAKAAKAQVNALNKLKESFEAFYGMEDLEDRVGENMTKGMTANINEVIKAFPNLQGEVYRTFDEMYDFIDAVMENISNDFTSSINTLKESLKSVSSEVETPAKKSAAETKNKVKSVEKAAASGITTDVVIKEGVGAELVAELKTVIDNLQKYVDKNPVELNAVINPTWGTKLTQKYLKSIREQLSKTKDGKIDENLAARIYGLQDAFGKDFSEALNKSISKLKDSLQKEGFSVGKLKIEESAISDFKNQLKESIGAIEVDVNANLKATNVEIDENTNIQNSKNNTQDQDIEDSIADMSDALVEEFSRNEERIDKIIENNANANIAEQKNNVIELNRIQARQGEILSELAKSVEVEQDDNSEDIKTIEQNVDNAVVKISQAELDDLYNRYNAIKNSKEIDLEAIDAIVPEFKRLNISTKNPKTVDELIIDALLKGKYSNAKEAVENIGHREKTPAKPIDPKELSSKLWEEFKTKIYYSDDNKVIDGYIKRVKNANLEKFEVPSIYMDTYAGKRVDSKLRDYYNKKNGNKSEEINSANVNIQTANVESDIIKNDNQLLTASHDELIALANQRFKELANSENIDFEGIESFVSDLRKIGVENINPKYTNNTVGRIVEAMLKGGYTSALEASKSTESQAKALEAQQMSKLFERFQKLYAMQSVQEKGTGSVKSIQMFVDAVRKSGVDFKVDEKYQGNEIGKLIDSMLTNNYKTVAEAIAVRDNKSVNQTTEKSLEKATINVTNLTIKGQQNIADAKQKITSANIEIKKGNTTVSGTVKSENDKTNKSNTSNKNGENKKLNNLIDKYNDSIQNPQNLSLIKWAQNQDKLLSEIRKLNTNNQSNQLNERTYTDAHTNESVTETEINNAREKLNKLLLDNNTPEARRSLFQSGKIYQRKYPHELSYALSNGLYQDGSANTLLFRGSTAPAIIDKYTTESIHNHPNGSLIPSMGDIESWFNDLLFKKAAIHSLSGDEFKKFTESIVTINSKGEGDKLSFDMSEYLSMDNAQINKQKTDLLYALVASELVPNLSQQQIGILNHLTNGAFSNTSYGDSSTENIPISELSDDSIESLNRLIEYVKNNILLSDIQEARKINGHGGDYRFIENFKNQHQNEIHQILRGEEYNSQDISDIREKIIRTFLDKVDIKDDDWDRIFSTGSEEVIDKAMGSVYRGVNVNKNLDLIPQKAYDIMRQIIDSQVSNIELNENDSNNLNSQNVAIQEYIEKINELISNTTDGALKTQLESLQASLKDNYSLISNKYGASGISDEMTHEALQQLISDANAVDDISATLLTKSKQIDVFLKNIEKIKDNIDGNENLKLSTSAQKIITESKEELDQLSSQLETAQQNNDYSGIDVKAIAQRILELKDGVDNAITQTVVDKIDIKGLIRKLDNLQIDEVKADPKIVDQVKSLRQELQDAVDDDTKEMLTEQYNDYRKQVSQLSGTVSKSDRTIFGNFMKELRHKNYQALAQFFSLNDIIRYMREAVNVIKQYDSALIEMMKVSDETRSSLERYQKTVFDTANAIGSAALTLNQSTADWMRIGESLTEAAESAKAAQILMNVSEFQDINSATQALVSASQAYADLDKMDIVDKINKLGNEFPIATDQLATALQNSAAALTTQGNDLNEALALVVGGNVITQDALKTGTGIRTIALRIAGTKEAKDELAELGEGVDDFVVRTESKTRKLIMDYTAVASNGFKGVDIYDDNGNLRSTYQILQDIADIYKEIQKEDRQAGTNRANALVELLAGKNRSNIAASILTNPDTIREAYEAAQNAEGSAMRENEKYLTSVEAHMTQFRNAVDELINDLVDSGFINDVIDFGTTLINGLDEIIKRFGGFNTLLMAAGLIAGGKTGFFASFKDNMPVLIEGLKEFTTSGSKVNEMTTLLGKSFENAKGEAIAFGTALKSAIGVGVITVIVAIVSQVNKYIQKIKEMRQASRDLAKETQEQNKTLDDYAKKIADARSIIEDETSTTNEIIDAKKELVNIQNELNESYDTYNEIIGNVNSSIEANNRLLLAQKQLNLDEAIASANATGEGRRATDFYENGFRGDDITLANVIEKYVGSVETFEGNSPEEYLKNLQELRATLVRSGNEEDIGWASYINDEITRIEEGIDNYSSVYLNEGENAARTLYKEAYAELEDAYINNLEKGTEQTEAALQEAVDRMYREGGNVQSITSWLEQRYTPYFNNIKKENVANNWSKEFESIAKEINQHMGESFYELTYEDILAGARGDNLDGKITDFQMKDIQELKDKFFEVGIDFVDGLDALVEKGTIGHEADIDFNTQLAEARQKAIDSGLMTADQFDSLGISTAEELDIWNQKVAGSATQATEAIRMYTLATSELEEALDASEMLKNMESQYKPAFDAMATAYQAIWSDKDVFQGTDKVTTEQIESVRSQIESINASLKEAGEEGVDTDVLDDFILKLSDASTDADTAQEAFNNLATAVVDSLNPALSHASGETATLMQKTLTELGVTNAAAVVFSRLGYTAEQYAAAKEEADKHNLDLDKEIGDLSAEELSLIANNEALMTLYQNRILYNNMDLNTEADIENMLELANAFGLAAVSGIKLAEIESRLANIDMLRSTGRSVMADHEFNKLKEDIIAGAEVGINVAPKYNGNSVASNDKSGSDSKQKFDWIERAIKKIQRAVTNLGKVADATYKKWGDRIDALMGKTEEFNDEIGGDKFYAGKYQKLKEEIALQEQAAQAYMAEADAIGLSAEYRSKVMNGLMDIETVTDEKLKEQISDFQEYYDKSTDAADAVEDLRGEIAQLAQTRFDYITKQFEEMALSIDHAATRIGHIQSTIESEGYFESTLLIEQLRAGAEDKLGQLQDEAQQLAASIDEAVSNGDIEYGSEQWWGMYDSLQNVNDQVLELQSNIAGYNDQIRQLEWDKFDYIQDSVSRLTEENEFLIDILQDEAMMFEKNALIGENLYANGNMSDAALSVQGLHVNSYQTLTEQAKDYAEEIEKINADLAKDPNNKKLLDRRNELIDQQRDIIKGISSEKQAIRDLIKQGYETFLDYLQKSIDYRKKALEAEKNLYDYERNVREQTEAITSYQQQLAALGGDNSEENRARLQQLTNDLKKAEEDLQQTEYDKWLSDQEEMMDNMYEAFEKLIDDRLDNLDELVAQAIDQTAASSDAINQTIREELDEFPYDLENTSFGINFDMKISDAVGAVDAVKAVIEGMHTDANVNAQNQLNALSALANAVATSSANQAAQIANQIAQLGNTGGSGGSGGNGSGSGSGGDGDGNGTNTAGMNLQKKQQTSVDRSNATRQAEIKALQEELSQWEQVYNINKSTADKYTPGSPNRTRYDQQAAIAKTQIDLLSEKIKALQFAKSKFAKGGTIGRAIKSTGEDGIILARTGEEVLSLERIRQMQSIFKMMQPLAALPANTLSNISSGTTINGMNVSFSLPNVTSYEDFVNKAKKDPQFEKIVQSMTIGTALGKSKLSKYSI